MAEKHYPVETEQKLEVNGVIGTDSNTETEYIVLAEQKEVPELYVTDTLSSMLNYFPLYSNSYEWYYKENGTESGTAATGMFPTLTAKMVDWLRLPEYQGMDTWLYHLNGEIIPDEVVVKEYSIFKLGDQDAEVRSEKTYTKENLLIELIPGRIYELTAVWDTGFYEERGYHGEVSYILVTDTEFATKEDLEKYAVLPKATFTRNAHIKEIYGNRILISSDTDELPGAFEVIIPKEVCDISELQCGQSIVIETFDTGEVNENGKIPVHEAVFLSSFNIVENEKIDLDNFTSD